MNYDNFNKDEDSNNRDKDLHFFDQANIIKSLVDLDFSYSSSSVNTKVIK